MLRVAIALLATVLSIAVVSTASADSAASTSTRASVVMWREAPERLAPGTVVTDHVFVKNKTDQAMDKIQVHQYWSSPSLIYVGWAGVGANTEAWSLKTIDASNFVATYAPEAGIEAGGVGEMVFLTQVKDPALWPVFPAPARAQADHTALVAEEGTPTQLLSTLTPQALLSSFFDLRIEATTNSLRAHRATGGLKGQILNAEFKTPFAVTYTGLGNWPQTTSYGGETKSCDTQLLANRATGAVNIRFSDCAPLDYPQYPFLAGGTGTAIPANGVSKQTGLIPEIGWQAMPGRRELTLDLSPFGIQLKLPPSQGVNFTYYDPEKKKEVKEQFWFDGKKWLAAPLEPGQTSRFSSSENLHEVHLAQNGTVLIKQFPYQY